MSADFTSLVPQCSPGLLIQKIGEQTYLISNPSNGFNLKVNAHTHAMLRQVDGQKNIEEITQALRVQIHPDLNNQIIFETLYRKLGAYGIIEQVTFEQKEKRNPSYLWLNFTLFNAAWTNRIAQVFTPLFRKELAWILSLIAMGIMVGAFAWYFQNMTQEKEEILANSYWLLLFLLGCSKIFHEFGHAAASKYYGVDSKGIGFGFYLLLPVTFADVSDIWRLPAKQRMVVNVAGMYFELLLNGFCLLLLWSLGWEQFFLFPLLVALSILLNLNPFIRLDGYWLLSDLTNVPNLMSAGRAKIMAFGQALKIEYWPSNFSLKDYGLLFYGLTSHMVIIIVLGYILLHDVNSIVSFPKDLGYFIFSFFEGNEEFWSTFTTRFKKLLPPFLFYYLLIRKTYNYWKIYWGNK